MFHRPPRSRPRIARKVISLLVLCGVLLGSMPIPIGWKPRISGGSEPYPCQHGNCGCNTAEKCWTNCCCLTVAQRLQWAEDNGVEPPSYAVPAHSKSKSATKPETAVCDAAATHKPKRAACCSASGGGKACPESVPSDDVAAEQEMILVLSMTAVKCQGGSSDFTFLPWAVMESAPPACTFAEPPTEPFRVENEWLPSAALILDDPPPRFGASIA